MGYRNNVLLLVEKTICIFDLIAKNNYEKDNVVRPWNTARFGEYACQAGVPVAPAPGRAEAIREHLAAVSGDLCYKRVCSGRCSLGRRPAGGQKPDSRNKARWDQEVQSRFRSPGCTFPETKPDLRLR